MNLVKILTLIVQLLKLRKDLLNPNVDVRNFAFDPIDLSLHVEKKNTQSKSFSFIENSTGNLFESNREG